MVKEIANEVEYYYDSNPTKEDLMTETSAHAELVDYLKEVLKWLFHGQVCAIYDNLGFYQTDYYREYPLAPDLAVIKGVNFDWVRHWRLGITGPAPHVVFEIASRETWKKDLNIKPIRYAQMGVQEYFLYDPNDPPLSRKTGQRLWGWQLGQDAWEMPLDPDGRLWSPHLESFLSPDGHYLRLYDRHGILRLTADEAHVQQAEAEAKARKAEARRANAATRRAEMEARAREAETKRADAEAKRADAEAQARQALAEKLRSLGIDPDSI